MILTDHLEGAEAKFAQYRAKGRESSMRSANVYPLLWHQRALSFFGLTFVSGGTYNSAVYRL
ncbi:MAG: hypothetical protein A4E19_17735 [Nitrospira sp. SG-bin1]|nr:MAG: hypothetical protein A4E19_17735 [Nitrospira sp. SG-bin1]